MNFFIYGCPQNRLIMCVSANYAQLLKDTSQTREMGMIRKGKSEIYVDGIAAIFSFCSVFLTLDPVFNCFAIAPS